MNSKEDWHPEIEEWKKTINDPFYVFKIMMEETKEMEKEPLTMMINGCSHQYTGWIENEFIFGECGLVLKKEITKKNELGYGFRGTHTLPAPYVRKRKK